MIPIDTMYSALTLRETKRPSTMLLKRLKSLTIPMSTARWRPTRVSFLKSRGWRRLKDCPTFL
jgi:hypothetical protein